MNQRPLRRARTSDRSGEHEPVTAQETMNQRPLRRARTSEVKMVDRLANSEANSKRIAVVEGCFGTAGQPLAIPGRVLIGEGVLTKLCRKKPKARQFFLFNDILSVTIDTVPDEGDLRNGWLIKTPTKSFAVYAATATEKSEWMNHIGKCVGDLLQKSGKAPTGEHAAVWVPDSEATVCMRCQKVKFTPVSRRHHCRKCGYVVCGPCSEKKYLLPSQSSKPVRVCEYCFVQLTSGSLGPRSDSISRPGSKFNNLSDDDDEDDSSD
ncbi:Pleckstrin-like proteiny domain-containing family F member 2 [Larimichthys crocea]|uniref:Pleckstrin-like proteiny domain-containing family F member 2 n=1 Tax=Larimichthys crocea TaxID=215358 RepID=A0A6G0ID33_LARCR|nr:Pleckstrin-like proteiny domain-containing family F member 2 [Larimichthys crocea]